MEKAKITVKDVTKVFGKSPKQAIKLLDQGKSKSEILKETGNTVGVNRASFDVYPVKSLSSWDYQVVVNLRLFVYSID